MSMNLFDTWYNFCKEIKSQLTTLFIYHIYAQKNKAPQVASLHKGSYKSDLRHLVLSLRVFNLII